MVESSGHRGQLRILLYLLAAGLVFLALGVGAHHYFGSTGLTVVDVTVSAFLSAALVMLYFRQTSILEAQHDLLAQELNREARQQHTETLRDRVRLWHGDPDRGTADNPLDQPGTNLPAVADASFESAPTGSYTAIPVEEQPFQVLPHRLEGDRYLADLFENHAPDLREKKEEIEELYTEFDSLRDEFCEDFDGGIIHETENFTFEPDGYFNRWMFETLVKYERRIFEDFEELRKRTRSQFKQGGSGFHPDKPQIQIRANIRGEISPLVYSAVLDGADRAELQEQRSEAVDEAEKLFEQVLDQLEEDYPYEQLERAAAVLDEAAAAIDELENLLVEYDGRPIYSGDCKYLEEARISNS
ncbi:hypothetical protein BDK88_4320 [Natrinema hispanicum]|uniref:Uncharacterized protein n=1 Tax=Natrinema hispanicum TaxID=392421 RepID=A0A482Y0T8_9EURY|nr:hypothetical protein [Natrinema hispanicum]RZV05081.1 hypothetical protein BDK88_4320 [Natrinema hispanicum]